MNTGSQKCSYYLSDLESEIKGTVTKFGVYGV